MLEAIKTELVSQEWYAAYFRKLALKASTESSRISLNAEAKGIEDTCTFIREIIDKHEKH